jgi:hypothetical protein
MLIITFLTLTLFLVCICTFKCNFKQGLASLCYVGSCDRSVLRFFVAAGQRLSRSPINLQVPYYFEACSFVL